MARLTSGISGKHICPCTHSMHMLTASIVWIGILRKKTSLSVALMIDSSKCGIGLRRTKTSKRKHFCKSILPSLSKSANGSLGKNTLSPHVRILRLLTYGIVKNLTYSNTYTSIKKIKLPILNGSHRTNNL